MAKRQRILLLFCGFGFNNSLIASNYGKFTIGDGSFRHSLVTSKPCVMSPSTTRGLSFSAHPMTGSLVQLYLAIAKSRIVWISDYLSIMSMKFWFFHVICFEFFFWQ